MQRERETRRPREGSRASAPVDEALDAGRAGEGGHTRSVKIHLPDDHVGRVGHEEQPSVAIDRQADRLIEAGIRAEAVCEALVPADERRDVVRSIRMADAHAADAMVAAVSDVEFLCLLINRQSIRPVE